jgi:hypothetical protein
MIAVHTGAGSNPSKESSLFIFTVNSCFSAPHDGVVEPYRVAGDEEITTVR